MSRIIELIRRVVQQELARNRGSLLGVVTTVYPHEAADDENNYEANVRLKHEDLELRRVPIAVGHVGVAAPPRVGDLVLVQFLNGDSNQPVVTGRFYHADERPPLHWEDEILLEHRVTDDTLNHLRFAADGSIFLQRDVTEQGENDSEAKATIKIDGKTGDIRITSGEQIAVVLTHDENKISVDCGTMKVTTREGMTVTGNVTVEGDLKVTNKATNTTIKGNEITGAIGP
jgi:uncharacterized protein involved in type VI secretion and phage assembly